MMLNIDVAEGILSTKNSSISLSGVTGCALAFEFISLLPLSIFLSAFTVQFYGIFSALEVAFMLVAVGTLLFISLGIVSVRVWFGSAQSRIAYCFIWTANKTKSEIKSHIISSARS